MPQHLIDFSIFQGGEQRARGELEPGAQPFEAIEQRRAPRALEVGLALLEQHGMKADLSTVVLIDEAGAHVRSTAALRVLRHLRRPYSLAYCLIALPAPLRDVGYRLVAKSRYAIWGKDEESCRRLTKAMRRRFIDLAPAA